MAFGLARCGPPGVRTCTAFRRTSFLRLQPESRQVGLEIHLAAECMCGTVDQIALKANGPA
jgi:hypothetical protein